MTSDFISSQQIAERAEQFRQQIGSLELLASTHNGILRSLTPLETPLMEPKLGAVMNAVQQHLMGLNWNSYHIDDAVSACLSQSRALADTQASVKGHMTQIQGLLKSWISRIIVETKAGQVLCSLQLWLKTSFE